MRLAAELQVRDLGTIPYREALALQHELRAERIAGSIPDTLLCLEHPSVYTRGRRSRPGELPFGAAWYAERGIEIVDVDRGGLVTYHGPGQLVVYAICRVDDLRGFVATLEQAIVGALAAAAGLEQARGRSPDGIAYTGVWIESRKIASIGLHRAQGVTNHGLAINVDCNLEPFTWIVPCGLPDATMTSVAAEHGRADPTAIRDQLVARIATALGVHDPTWVEPAGTAPPVA